MARGDKIGEKRHRVIQKWVSLGLLFEGTLIDGAGKKSRYFSYQSSKDMFHYVWSPRLIERVKGPWISKKTFDKLAKDLNTPQNMKAAMKTLDDEHGARVDTLTKMGVRSQWVNEHKIYVGLPASADDWEHRYLGKSELDVEPVKSVLGSCEVIEPYEVWPSDDLVGRMALAYAGGQRNARKLD